MARCWDIIFAVEVVQEFLFWLWTVGWPIPLSCWWIRYLTLLSWCWWLVNVDGCLTLRVDVDYSFMLMVSSWHWWLIHIDYVDGSFMLMVEELITPLCWWWKNWFTLMLAKLMTMTLLSQYWKGSSLNVGGGTDERNRDIKSGNDYENFSRLFIKWSQCESKKKRKKRQKKGEE